MGQPITVVEKPSPRRDVVRFETNRSLTGMGHESYRSAADASGRRPVDELARRLFDAGGVDALHVYGNIITIDCTKGFDGKHLAEVIHELFIHYTPGVVPPSDEELIAKAEG